MTSIRGAMQAVYGLKPKAKVTFVVVQKRHHTRFFPLEQRFSEGKNQNIMAGTVVDKDIVHPFQYQFFMASHAAIQGVTKPTKYCVLINESKISPDDLQAMTYGTERFSSISIKTNCFIHFQICVIFSRAATVRFHIRHQHIMLILSQQEASST